MLMIDGNIDGIRRSYLERLEAVYEIESDRTRFCAQEILDVMGSFTGTTGREVMVYLDRAGRVLTVAVGEHDRVSLPALKTRRSEDRLSGIRCIHTHPGGTPNLSNPDIQSLKILRLDAMAAVSVSEDGQPTKMQVGILESQLSNDDFTVGLFGPYRVGEIPDEELWTEIHLADARIRPAEAKKTQEEEKRSVVVGLDNGLDEGDVLRELADLADTAGYEVVGSLVQSRDKPEKTYYLGYGKLRDLALLIQSSRAEVVIFDDELSAAQIRNIEKVLGEIKIVDRTSLILEIFSNRASTHEGRLQVELAQTKYLLPRMVGYWTHMSRQGGGGSGGGGAGARRGEGEKQLEVDRRILRRRITDLEKEIDKIKSRRDVQRGARSRAKIPIVALVGYTNAGKSTILNYLSGSDVLAEDKLFATLDPISRRVSCDSGEFLLVDTVGFINKLPHDLVDAFRATLEEVKYADLLLHIVDASSENRRQQMDVVQDVLNQLNVGDKPTLKVYNKCDLLGEPFSGRENICVSAATGEGMESLTQAVAKQLTEVRTEVSAILPSNAGALVSSIYARGQMLDCQYLEDGIHVTAILSPEDAARLRAAAGEG